MDGALVDGTDLKPLTPEQAAASAKDRNERAGAMGIKTRYQATND